MAVNELEGYDEVMQKMLDTLSPEQRVAGLSPEQVLSAFAPEQVLSAFAPEQVLLALPDVALRSLSEDYVATLPQPVQAVVRGRRGQ